MGVSPACTPTTYLTNIFRPAHGNEKGTVESLAKWVRSRGSFSFPPIPYGTSVTLTCFAGVRSKKEKHADSWKEEQTMLQVLPISSFSSARPLSVKVNTYSLIVLLIAKKQAEPINYQSACFLWYLLFRSRNTFFLFSDYSTDSRTYFFRYIPIKYCIKYSKKYRC